MAARAGIDPGGRRLFTGRQLKHFVYLQNFHEFAAELRGEAVLHMVFDFLGHLFDSIGSKLIGKVFQLLINDEIKALMFFAVSIILGSLSAFIDILGKEVVKLGLDKIFHFIPCLNGAAVTISDRYRTVDEVGKQIIHLLIDQADNLLIDNLVHLCLNLVLDHLLYPCSDRLNDLLFDHLFYSILLIDPVDFDF